MVDVGPDTGLAVITIDRPHALNAIAPETMDRLDADLDRARGAPGLVIRGGGDRAFVSGPPPKFHGTRDILARLSGH